MSVLIRGMEMPKACIYYKNGHLTTCPLYDIDGYCSALNTEAIHQADGKLQNCPLVELPSHGDLIDKGVLKISLLGEEYGTNFPTVFNQIIKVVNSVPVVVESEEE